MPRRLCILLVLTIAPLTLLAPAATADRDAASDYVPTQPLFVPFSVCENPRTKELSGLLTASAEARCPPRVAVTGARSGLGGVPVLFKHPKRYARFLGLELYDVVKDGLLVVMPNGYALYWAKGSVPEADTKPMEALLPPRTSDPEALIEATTAAVRVLASNRRVELPDATPSWASSLRTDELIGGVVLLVALLGFALRRWHR